MPEQEKCCNGLTFMELVNRQQGEVILAIGAGNFKKAFWDAMDAARQFGERKAREENERVQATNGKKS